MQSGKKKLLDSDFWILHVFREIYPTLYFLYIFGILFSVFMEKLHRWENFFVYIVFS
jgi:hypothetical protein